MLAVSACDHGVHVPMCKYVFAFFSLLFSFWFGKKVSVQLGMLAEGQCSHSMLCTGISAMFVICLRAPVVGTSSMTSPVLHRASTATLLHPEGSFLHEAGADPAECCRLGAEAGAAGHLLELPPGSSAPALLVLGEPCFTPCLLRRHARMH